MSPSNGNYYYGLMHKKTHKWVDLFPKLDTQGLVPIKFNGKTYLAESIENQVGYIAKDLIRRNVSGSPVRNKWVHKLRELYDYPGLNKSLLNISEIEIKQALNAKPSSKLRDWLLTAIHLFKSKTITPNGLSAKPSKLFFN